MVLGAAPIPNEVVKESANGFDPLKAILGAISADRTDHKVCEYPAIQDSSLTNLSAGIIRYQKQD